ncbi:unnamed protein product [Urochloa humidicola]
MAVAAGTAALLRSHARRRRRLVVFPRRVDSTQGLGALPRTLPRPLTAVPRGRRHPAMSIKADLVQTAKAESIRMAFNYASILVSGGMLFHCWIMPKMDESLSRERKRMKDDIIQVIKHEFEIQRIEGVRRKAKNSEGQSMQISGHDKEHGGLSFG